MTDWVDIGVTAFLGIGALYFANSLHRKTRADVAEKRFAAYAALWAELRVASPMRGSPPTTTERSDLYDKLTNWYYDSGHGMLLTEQTRNIYLKAKENLRGADSDRTGGRASVSQLSLLRTSMRADLRIFTRPYAQELNADDVAFLKACKVNLRKNPWRKALPEKRRSDSSSRPMELERLNELMFQAEAHRPCERIPWRDFLDEVLSETFIIRRSAPDKPFESKEAFLEATSTSQPLARTIVPGSVRLWRSDLVAAVVSVIEVEGRPERFTNTRVFTSSNGRFGWRCEWWQVTGAKAEAIETESAPDAQP